MRPVDIYLRVSRVGGRENLISPDEQERRARALAAERGLRVGKVLTDLDESGGKWDRPGLQEALERVRTGVSGGLIVAWLDRLSRDSEHAHRLIRELHEAGGRVYAPDAPSDWTSPEGELQAGIVFAFAQYVRSRARAGFERSKQQAIERGIPVANRAPVGYVKGADRRLEPDPAVAPVVRELFERRAAGAGPSELADFLMARGVRTSQGSASWSKQAVAHVLASRVYLGELSYGKDRRFVNAGAHEALVDLPTWLAAQHPNGRRSGGARAESRYSLGGLLRCAACGYVMQPTTSPGRSPRYRCVRRHAGGICPEPVSVVAAPIEALVDRIFWRVQDDRMATPEAPEVDVSELVEALERAEQRLAQATTPEMQDALGDGWPALVKERRRERDAAAEALGRARAEQASPTADPTTLRAVWHLTSPAERRDVYATRFDAFALCRGGEVVVIPRGSGFEFSRRGFRRESVMRPVDPPPGAWVEPLEDAAKDDRELVTA